MNGSRASTAEFLAPVSIGEAVDKITILRIKQSEISDPSKLANIKNELVALETTYVEHVGQIPERVEALTCELQGVNRKLWNIEDEIRDCESRQDFGPRFVDLARSVYFVNDERATIKRKINMELGSALVEEKSYRDYTTGQGNKPSE